MRTAWSSSQVASRPGKKSENLAQHPKMVLLVTGILSVLAAMVAGRAVEAEWRVTSAALAPGNDEHHQHNLETAPPLQVYPLHLSGDPTNRVNLVFFSDGCKSCGHCYLMPSTGLHHYRDKEVLIPTRHRYSPRTRKVPLRCPKALEGSDSEPNICPGSPATQLLRSIHAEH